MISIIAIDVTDNNLLNIANTYTNTNTNNHYQYFILINFIVIIIYD